MRRGASADPGICFVNVHELIERDSETGAGLAVFAGTSVPVEFLFQFLGDNQTMETFLDQFPAVTRDQARGVLSASRDLLLTIGI